MTARERRTVRWGGAALGAILAYVLVLDPWLVRAAERRDAIAAAEARLGRLLTLERSLPDLRERLALARAVWAEQVEPRLVPGQAPAVAASTVSQEVRSLAAASLLEVERESPLAFQEEDGLGAVPVQFSLRGDVYGLRDFLGALETAGTLLHLRELRVSSVANPFGPAAPGAPLQVTVTLEGYLGADAPANDLGAPPALPSAGFPPELAAPAEALPPPRPASSTEPLADGAAPGASGLDPGIGAVAPAAPDEQPASGPERLEEPD